MLRRAVDVASGAMMGAAAASALLLEHSQQTRMLPASQPEESAAAIVTHEEAGSSSASPSWRAFCKWGLPSDEHVTVKHGYAASVNYRTRQPNWVAEHLEASASNGEGVSRKKARFYAEEGMPPMFSANNADYSGSGFSRGHLAPASSHKQSQTALDETFSLSCNVVPQEMSSNGSDWLRLERLTQSLLRSYADVWVVSGPLFLPSTEGGRKTVSYQLIGKNDVAVPSHLFKVVYAEDGASGRRRLGCFILPNRPLWDHDPLDDFAVPLEEIERLSGLTFFPEMEDRHKVPRLCGRGRSVCGVGRLDPFVEGAKTLGRLRLSADCETLRSVWDSSTASKDASPRGPASSEMKRASERLACGWTPPTRDKDEK